MKMTQRIAIFAMATLSTLTATAATTTLRLDTRTAPIVADSIAVTYDASWIGGDAGATVVISDNGAEAKRTTGAGVFAYQIPTGSGCHELTLVTFVGGVAQKEIYRAEVWSPKTSVTLDQQGGSGGSANVTATYGSAMPSITVPTRTGYTFGGYYTSTGGSGTQYYTASGASVRSWNKTAATTLYAKWTAKTYTVMLDRESGSGGTESVTATYGSAMPSITRPTRTGYTFGGYYTSTDGTGTQYYTASGASARNWDMAATTTLYAKWTVITATVTLNRQNGSGGTASVTATYGSAMPSITVPTRTGYTFGGYFTSTGGWGTQYYTDSGTSARNWDATARTLYAKWTANEYTVSFDATEGTVNQTSKSVTFDAAYGALPTPTRLGYSANWTLDGGIVTAGTVCKTASDHTLTAVWSPNDYTVSFDAAGGAVSPASKSATFDAAYGTMPTPARTGYTFGGWTLSGATVTAETICTQPSNHVLTAAWTPNEYTVSFDAKGGAANPASKGVTFDSAYGALPTPVREPYVFVDWRLGGAMVDAETDVTTPSNHVLSARWGVSIGGGVWEETICDGPIMLGAPLVAPSGEVVVPAEIDDRPVVEIGAEAFAGNTAITSISIPASVTNVAEGAFAGCTGLKTVAVDLLRDNRFTGFLPELAETVERVVFLDGVTIIPDNFFEGCTALKSMDIPESVVDIGTNVFEACSALATTTVGGLEMYQGWCLGFAEDAVLASQVASLEIPEEYEDVTARPEGSPHHGTPYRVRGIAAGAFEGETGIGTAALPETLRFIGAGAFEDCTSLENVIVPDGVRKIDRDAFRNCTYALELTLPPSLRVIGDGAFANCTSLMSLELPCGVEGIGGCAFSNCWRAVSVSIPQSVERIGAGAFADCRRVSGATVPLHVAPMSELFPAAYATMTDVWVAEMDGSLGELAPPEAEGGSPGGLAPPFETRQMVPGMFAGCAAVEAIALPEWVRNVPDGAFEGCTALASVSLPDGVTNIAARAFAGCTALPELAFPADLVTIGEEAFDGDAGIASLALPEGLRTIGARAFRGLSPLARADIPGSVREIGADAFAGCAAIRAISMPGDAGTVADAFPDAYASIVSATVVAETDEDGASGGRALPVLMSGLFEGCAALTRVELPQDLAEIGASAFLNCSGLAEVGIPSAVTNIGASAFQNCSTLSSIALPKNLEVLQDGTFAGCTSLAGITIPDGVGTLGNGVFSGCTLLRSVRFVGNAPSYSSASGGPYSGVPARAKSYVANGSMGWDGIPTSKALPEFWPAGTTYEIAFWTPNRYNVSFDPCDGTAPVEVEQVTGTSYVLPADPVRQGASFGGWWTAAENGARITASTPVTATRPHTCYAHWTMNRYFIHLDANGGSGTASPVEMTVGTAAALPPCPFAYVAHAFMGWATTPDGPVVYADGATVGDLAYANNAAVTLYAVWAERDWAMPDYLDAPGLTFETEGGGEWSGDWEEFKVGGASLASGELPPSEIAGEWTNTVLRTTVFGEGSLSFWWKVSCEPEDPEYGDWFDFATFTVDGVEVARIAGESGWRKAECAVTGAGTHSLEWTFFRDDYDEDGADYDNALWVDGVEWTPAPVAVSFDAGGAAEGEAPAQVVKWAGYALVLPGPGTLADPPRVFAGWSDGENVYAEGETYVFGSADATLTAVWSAKTWTLGEAVDAPAMSFATGGNDVWAVDTAAGWTNGVSAKSGAVANGQSSWIETTVAGGGTLAFRWKVMGGLFRNTPFAYAKVEIDGMQAVSTHLTDGWEGQALEIAGAGTHTVRWTYLRTSARDCDGDCAWLDGVSWTPLATPAYTETQTTPEPVPYSWLDADAATILAAHGGDYEEAAKATAANGVNKVWECYVAGISPTNAAARFEATIEMGADGKPVVRWNPPLAPEEEAKRMRKVLGKRTLVPTEDWADVTDEADPDAAGYRFFKVKVEMK